MWKGVRDAAKSWELSQVLQPSTLTASSLRTFKISGLTTSVEGGSEKLLLH